MKPSRSCSKTSHTRCDDESAHESLPDPLREFAFAVQAFPSAGNDADESARLFAISEIWWTWRGSNPRPPACKATLRTLSSWLVLSLPMSLYSVFDGIWQVLFLDYSRVFSRLGLLRPRQLQKIYLVGPSSFVLRRGTRYWT